MYIKIVALEAYGVLPLFSSFSSESSGQIRRSSQGFARPAASLGMSVVKPVSGGWIHGKSSPNKAGVSLDLEGSIFSPCSFSGRRGGGRREKVEKLKSHLRSGAVGGSDLGGLFFPSSIPASCHGGRCGVRRRELINPFRFGSRLQPSSDMIHASGQLHPLQLMHTPIFWLWSYWFLLSRAGFARAARQGQMREPLSPSPRCGEPGNIRLSSVKHPQNLQLNPLPPVHKSDRPSVEPPAGHQLTSTISEALEGSVSCFAPDFSPGQAGGFCRRLQRLLAVALVSYLCWCKLLYVDGCCSSCCWSFVMFSSV